MRRTLGKALLALLLLSGTAASLSACNTVAGAGEDIEGASRGVQKHL